eukprot:TRINITY_DN75644_c0_g1_i1.p1 TRINITY_DN75644_c0_g1~~TRINITY_DN75644_c0_g1_i1.p1  ORF type:complete len:720 (+),score=95.42 TRINITY_DN75644_c0_g1_i1:80-2239(+)
MANVTLHIYDLADKTAVVGLNKVLRAVGSGAYHAGIEVYSNEWSFGSSPGPFDSGLFCCPPRGCEAHSYRESIVLGKTMISEPELDVMIDKLAIEWPADGYDLLRHNCCHFCEHFALQLGVGPVPEFLTRLAGVGAMLRSGIRMALGGGSKRDSRHTSGPVGVSSSGAFGQRESVFGPNAAMLGPPGPGPMFWPPQVPTGPAGPWLGAGPLTDRGPHHGPGPCGFVPVGGGYGPGSRKPSTDLSADFQERQRKISANGAIPFLGAAVEGNDFEPRFHGMLYQATVPKVGDRVEVYSNTHGAWCPGSVLDREGVSLVVAYRPPGAGPEEWGRKVIPAGHKDLRFIEGTPTYSEGDRVEVFSNSLQVWCPGRVERIRGGFVMAAFLVPGAGPNDWSTKELPVDHKDIRRPVDEAIQKYSAEMSTGTLEPAAELHLLPEMATMPSTSMDAFRVGDSVEVFSNSKQVWCLGVIESISGRKLVASFVLPGDTMPCRKELSAYDKDLRRPEKPKVADPQQESGEDISPMCLGDEVEIFSNSQQAWCAGRVSKMADGKVTVAFQLPGAAADDWVEKIVSSRDPCIRRLAIVAAQATISHETSIIPVWTAEENEAYLEAFREISRIATVENQDMALFLKSSGLSRQVLKEVWEVANPDGKLSLSFEEFAACCRLVAHCQAMQRDPASAGFLPEAGGKLRIHLQRRCLGFPPPTLPVFNNITGQHSSG